MGCLFCNINCHLPLSSTNIIFTFDSVRSCHNLNIVSFVCNHISNLIYSVNTRFVCIAKMQSVSWLFKVNLSSAMELSFFEQLCECLLQEKSL